jgi:hypothetical protein
MEDDLCEAVTSGACNALKSLVPSLSLACPSVQELGGRERSSLLCLVISGRRVSGHGPHAVGVAF